MEVIQNHARSILYGRYEIHSGGYTHPLLLTRDFDAGKVLSMDWNHVDGTTNQIYGSYGEIRMQINNFNTNSLTNAIDGNMSQYTSLWYKFNDMADFAAQGSVGINKGKYGSDYACFYYNTLADSGLGLQPTYGNHLFFRYNAYHDGFEILQRLSSGDNTNDTVLAWSSRGSPKGSYLMESGNQSSNFPQSDGWVNLGFQIDQNNGTNTAMLYVNGVLELTAQFAVGFPGLWATDDLRLSVFKHSSEDIWNNMKPVEYMQFVSALAEYGGLSADLPAYVYNGGNVPSSELLEFKDEILLVYGFDPVGFETELNTSLTAFNTPFQYDIKDQQDPVPGGHYIKHIPYTGTFRFWADFHDYGKDLHVNVTHTDVADPNAAPEPTSTSTARSMCTYGVVTSMIQDLRDESHSEFSVLNPPISSFDGDGAFMVSGWFKVPDLLDTTNLGLESGDYPLLGTQSIISAQFRWENPENPSLTQFSNLAIRYSFEPEAPQGFYAQFEGYDNSILYESAPINHDGWHHIAVIVRNSNEPGVEQVVREAYVDGVKIHSDPEAGGNYPSSNAVQQYKLFNQDRNISNVSWQTFPNSYDLNPETETDPENKTAKGSQFVFVGANSSALANFNVNDLYNGGTPLETGAVRTLLGALDGTDEHSVLIYDFSPGTLIYDPAQSQDETNTFGTHNQFEAANSPDGYDGTETLTPKDLIIVDQLGTGGTMIFEAFP